MINLRLFTWLLLILGVFSIYFANTQHVWTYFILKGLTTSIVFLSVLLWGTKQNKSTSIVKMALFLCLIGDLFLVWEHFFLWGVFTFFIAQSLFSIAFILRDSTFNNWGILLLLLLFGTFHFAQLLGNLEGLRIPVALYTLVITFMAWRGISNYFNNKSTQNLLTALGVIFFMLSDSLLSWDKFVTFLPYAEALILSTYWIAITSIAYSTFTGIESQNK